MNKISEKTHNYIVIVTTDGKYLMRENVNDDPCHPLPVWHYSLTNDIDKALKVEDTFIAGVMVDDFTKQVRKDVAAACQGLNLTLELNNNFTYVKLRKKVKTITNYEFED